MEETTIQDRLAALEAEVALLRSQVPSTPPPVAESQAAAQSEPEPVHEVSGLSSTSRRALIGGAVAGAAAVVTGALVGAQPAAATTGAMQYGAANNAGTTATTLSSSGSPTLGVTNTGGGSALSATGSTGAALSATTTSGRAVDISTAGGTGIWSQTDTGIAGVFATNSGGGVEVLATRWHLWLRADGRLDPTKDTVPHFEGEIVLDGNQDVWVCTENGTPGTWRKLGGGSTAGTYHLLPAPVRIYDSRGGTSPSVGPKTPLAAGEIRSLAATANSSGVPVGATGVVLTCMVVNAVAGGGNFTVWADGVAKPSANSMVWGGADGRHSTLAVSALSGAGKIRVSSSIKTDVVVDVVGYYR